MSGSGRSPERQGSSTSQKSLLAGRSGSSSRNQASSRRSSSFDGSTDYAEKRKSRSRKKAIIIAVSVIAGVLLVGVGVAWGVLGWFGGKINTSITSDSNLTDLHDNGVLADTTQLSSTDPFYVLLLGIDKNTDRVGSDEYGDGPFRSDTMILARVDPGSKKICLVSIHRDTWIDLNDGTTDYGMNKINAAYFYGGPSLAIKTVSELCGVPISHYIEVDLDGFTSIVDALGGVEVDVPISFYDPYLEAGLDAGVQTLNGWQAQVFCRARHAFDDLGDGDVYRAEHQRMFLKALAKKIMSSDVATMTSTITTLSNYVGTDMSLSDILAYAEVFKGIDTDNDIYSIMVPTEGQYTDGTWYEILDEQGLADIMVSVEAGRDPNGDVAVDTSLPGENPILSSTTAATATGAKTVTVQNGTETVGLATTAAETLQGTGKYTCTAENADATDYTDTIVVYNSTDADGATNAADIIASIGGGTAVVNDGTYSFTTDYLVIIGSDMAG